MRTLFTITVILLRKAMFKYWSIKKYGNKLLPLLEKRYGIKDFYTPSEVRATVYQQDFKPNIFTIGLHLMLKKSRC